MAVLVSGVALNIPRGAPRPDPAVLSLAQNQGVEAARRMQEKVIADIKRRRAEAQKKEAIEVQRQVRLIKRQRLSAKIRATQAGRVAAEKPRVAQELVKIQQRQANTLAAQEPTRFAAKGDALALQVKALDRDIEAHNKRGDAFGKIANTPTRITKSSLGSLNRSIVTHNEKGKELDDRAAAVNVAVGQFNKALSDTKLTAQPTLSAKAARSVFEDFTSDASLKNLGVVRKNLVSTDPNKVLAELRKNPRFTKGFSESAQILVAEAQANFIKGIKSGGSGIDALAAAPIPISGLVKVALLPIRGVVKGGVALTRVTPTAVKTTARVIIREGQTIARGEGGFIKVGEFARPFQRTAVKVVGPEDVGRLLEDITRTSTRTKVNKVLDAAKKARQGEVQKLLDASQANKKIAEAAADSVKVRVRPTPKSEPIRVGKTKSALIRERLQQASEISAKEQKRRIKQARELLKGSDKQFEKLKKQVNNFTSQKAKAKTKAAKDAIRLAEKEKSAVQAAEEANKDFLRSLGSGEAVVPGAVEIRGTGVVLSPIIRTEVANAAAAIAKNLPATATTTQVKTALSESLLNSTQLQLAVKQALQLETLPATATATATATKTIVDQTVLSPRPTPARIRPRAEPTRPKSRPKGGFPPRPRSGRPVLVKIDFPKGGPFPNVVTYRSGKFWVLQNLNTGTAMFRKTKPLRARPGTTIKETFTTLTKSAKPPKQRELDRGVFRLFVNPTGVTVTRA